MLPSLLANDRIGEGVHENALPEDAIPQFRTPQDETWPGAWKPIDDTIVGELARRSGARVAADERLQEIVAEIAKRDEDDGVLHLAELLENDETGAASAGSLGGDTASAGGNDDAAADEEEPPSPQLEEALRVLADLIQLSS